MADLLWLSAKLWGALNLRQHDRESDHRQLCSSRKSVDSVVVAVVDSVVVAVVVETLT